MSFGGSLAHAYLLAGDPQECTKQIKEELEELFAEQARQIEIDVGVVETLTIEMARSLNQRGRQRARGEARCIIRGFQLATRPAQNALLKTLEEPAEGIHFFLVTPTPKHLLETVRSRAARLSICTQANAEVATFVDNFLQAENLPERLTVAESVVDSEQLVGFVAGLASRVDDENRALKKALETVSPWLQESGRSDTQIAEFLAIAASYNMSGR